MIKAWRIVCLFGQKAHGKISSRMIINHQGTISFPAKPVGNIAAVIVFARLCEALQSRGDVHNITHGIDGILGLLKGSKVTHRYAVTVAFVCALLNIRPRIVRIRGRHG